MKITKLSGTEVLTKSGIKKVANPDVRASLKSQPGEKQLKHIDDVWIDEDHYSMSDDEYFNRQAKAEMRRKKWNNFKKALKDLFD
jgi:hypothetical protein